MFSSTKNDTFWDVNIAYITCFSQQKYGLEVKILDDEHWWGGEVWDGHMMPFDEGYAIDLKGNQAQPLFISDKGRGI